MIKVWINKQIKDDRPDQYKDSLIFDILDKNNKSNVKTNVEDLWRRFGKRTVKPINEDFLIVAMSIFCADKRVPRSYFADSWTRHISINIPVVEIEKWQGVKDNLEVMLNFLSGDKWSINFRSSTNRLRGGKESRYKIIKNREFDGVSLFSGGLDSFCGSLKLFSENKRICYVGYREYGLLSNRQSELFGALGNYYKQIDKEMLLFNVTPLRPLGIPQEVEKCGVENSSRSRSFLFLAGALAVASQLGDEVPVYIPENGFIGINVPLTDSRHGSCSTRTTHPYFIRMLNGILRSLGINNKVVNFYSFMTKGEIVSKFSENPVFKEYAKKTISCSHPCQSRYDKIKPPINCGYCYPCIIRRAAMNKINYDESGFYNPEYSLTKDFIDQHNNFDGKASDFRAILLSLKDFLDNEKDENFMKYILLKHGMLSKEELEGYKRVYCESMKEIYEMIKVEDRKTNGGIIDYLGIKKDIEEVVQG